MIPQEYHRKIKELTERKLGINVQMKQLRKKYQDEQTKKFINRL